MKQNSQPQIRRIKIFYPVALALLALIMISSSLLMKHAIDQNKDDSRVINLSGRQRMLSQRLTKCALTLSQEESPAKWTQWYKELEFSFPMWRTAHLGLQFGNESLDLPARENSPEIKRLFAEIEPSREAMEKAILRFFRKVEAQDGKPDREAARDTARVLLQREPEFLTLMDRITFQFESEARARTEYLSNMELVLMGIGLLVLFLEFIFIFRPSLKRLSILKE